MPPNKAYKAKREARRAEVAKLLRAAIPVYRIAEKLEIDRRTATADVNWLLAEWAKEQRPEDRHQWRALELAKLDEIEPKNLSDAKKGNQGAIDRALRIMERRAKILGLDAPTKQEVDLKNIDRMIEAELERISGRKVGDAGPTASDALGSSDGAGDADEEEDGGSPN